MTVIKFAFDLTQLQLTPYTAYTSLPLVLKSSRWKLTNSDGAHQEGLRKGAEVAYFQQQMELHRQKALEHEVTVEKLKCAAPTSSSWCDDV